MMQIFFEPVDFRQRLQGGGDLFRLCKVACAEKAKYKFGG